MMELRLLLALALTALFCGVHSQVDMDLRRLCNAQSVCRDCIQASHLCSWCADPNFAMNSPRCYPTGDPEVTCSPTFEQDPQGGAGNADMRPLEGITQISPASIDVSVRPGQPSTFPLSIRPARNFPIDLYLLMDLSFSMNDDLNNLKRLGADLAASIVGISNNFTIGFGSFVDKRLGPYVNLREAVQNNPCLNNNNFPSGCVPTYSYRHVVRLTTDRDLFDRRVQDQQISGNQDAPEGGFDGFLQSIVCTELVGWRNLSRKLLLYITDAGFHYANDGKLGGVILPHDGLCKVPTPSDAGTEVDYNDWDVYDYPSIGQIAEALRRNDIIPIFAAEARARPIYDELVNELGTNGAFTGTLAADSSNVVTLVRDLYNTISQRILFDPQPIPGVSFNITPTNCPGVVTADGTCTGVQIEQTATFDVSVSLTECNAENSGRTINVPIRVVGFGTFNVRLTAVCSCPCEMTPVVDSTQCGMQGNLTCGICECNEGRLGEMCQCDAAGIGGTGLMCPLGPTDIQCTRSDRGTCVCGECICRTNAQGEPEFYGPACECDDSRCGRVDGLLCSGRGTCTCNGCQCNVEPTTSQPYINGDLGACECTPATNCIDPRNNTATCNGRGECGCDGTCQCVPPYSGTYCERCSGSNECTENCDLNLVCAECALEVIEPYAMTLTQEEFFADGLLMREGIPPGSRFVRSSIATGGTDQLILPPAEMFCDGVTAGMCPTIIIINGTSAVDYEINGTESVRCEGLVNGCTYRYFVAVDESTTPAPNSNPFLDLHVEFLRSCPEPVASTAPWIIAIAIIIPLLVLGLLALLLLKVLLLIFDAIEVKRFEEELARTKYSKNENPLYRSAAKDYENPLYGK